MMYILITFIFVVFFISSILEEKPFKIIDAFYRSFKILIILFGIIIISIPINIAMDYCIPEENKKVIEINKTEIIPLNETTIVSAEESYCSYLYIDPQYGMTSKKINFDRIYVKPLEEDEKPYVIAWEKKLKNDFLNLLIPYWSKTYYTFYLPQDYQINNIYKNMLTD